MVWHLPPAMAQHAQHISEAGQKLDRQLQANAQAAHHDVVYRFTPQGPHQRPYHADNEACTACMCNDISVRRALAPVKLQGDPALPATLRAPSNPAPYRWAGTAQVKGSGKRGETHEWPHAGHTGPPTLRRWKRTCLMRNFLIGLLQCVGRRHATQLSTFGTAWGLHHGNEHMDRTHVAYPCTSTMVAAQCKVQPCCANRRAPLQG